MEQAGAHASINALQVMEAQINGAWILTELDAVQVKYVVKKIGFVPGTKMAKLGEHAKMNACVTTVKAVMDLALLPCHSVWALYMVLNTENVG